MVVSQSDKDVQNKYNKAVSCFKRQDYAKAEELLKEVLKSNPRHADAFYHMGLLALKFRKNEAAISLFNNAIAINPTEDYYINLGNAFFGMTRYDKAADCYKKVLEMNPKSNSAYNNLGVAYEKQDQRDKAVECYRKAIEINPDAADAYSNLGISLNRIDQIQEAMECYRKAIKIKPDHVDAHYNYAVAYKDNREVKKAIQYYEKTLKLNSRYMDAYLNLGIAYLLDRNFDKGWKYYEYRFTGLQEPMPTLPKENMKPKWDGSSLTDKIIYVYHEQGVGDTIQFIRFLDSLNHLGAKRVLFKCQAGLESLLIASNLKADIIANSIPDNLVDFDIYIPLLSLPYLLKTNDNNIPCRDKYLKADINKVIIYKHKYFKTDKFKVGIFWQGSVDHKGDKKRSLSLEHFYPLFEFPDMQVYSLQKGFGSEQLKNIPANYNIINLGETFNDFSDTAAAIENLDLLITIDTSVAHLAGSMGKPVWTILPTELEWRWFQDEESTVWYDSMRLFRPKLHTDRTETMDRIFQTLKEKFNNRTYAKTVNG